MDDGGGCLTIIAIVLLVLILMGGGITVDGVNYQMTCNSNGIFINKKGD